MYAVGGQIDTWCSPQPDTSSSISEPLLLSSSELLSLPPPSAPCVYSQSRRLYILKRIFSYNETHRIIAKTNLFCDCHLYFTCPSMSCVICLPSLLAEASISVCCAEHCILQTSSHSRNHPLHPAKECPNWARAHHTRLAALGEVPICPVWRTQRRWLADRLLLWTRQGGSGLADRHGVYSHFRGCRNSIRNVCRRTISTCTAAQRHAGPSGERGAASFLQAARRSPPRLSSAPCGSKPMCWPQDQGCSPDQIGTDVAWAVLPPLFPAPSHPLHLPPPPSFFPPCFPRRRWATSLCPSTTPCSMPRPSTCIAFTPTPARSPTAKCGPRASWPSKPPAKRCGQAPTRRRSCAARYAAAPFCVRSRIRRRRTLSSGGSGAVPLGATGMLVPCSFGQPGAAQCAAPSRPCAAAARCLPSFHGMGPLRACTTRPNPHPSYSTQQKARAVQAASPSA